MYNPLDIVVFKSKLNEYVSALRNHFAKRRVIRLYA